MDSYQQTLDTARAETGVTGASFAYWDGEALHTAVSGARNSVTGDPVTADTVMHIGSITKIFNAAMVMQLVDDGLIRLEDPVVKYLPDFRLADMEAARTITCGMLLNHTSGISCVVMPDYGPDKERIVDAIARFAELKQLHAPGEAASYNNAATVVAGHLTQTLRGESWYTVVKKRIFEPLGMVHALADLTDLPRFRCSVGDVTSPETGQLVQTTRPFLSPSFAPAGATLMMSAADLVTFGRAMVTGVGPNGARILSEASARRMAKPTSSFTFPAGMDIGIGWMLPGGGVATHGGGGPGVMSQLYVHLETGRVLVLLTNCDRFDVLKPAVTGPIIASWSPDATPASAPQRPATPVAIDASLYEGAYETPPYRVEVFSQDGDLAMRTSLSFSVYDSIDPDKQPPANRLIPYGDDLFEVEGTPAPAGYNMVKFIPGPDGRMKLCAAMPFNLSLRVQ